jgi:heptosyltransferase-3
VRSIHIDHDEVRKILVIKLRAVGDVVLSTIVLKNLALAFPDSQLDFLTEKPSKDVLAGNPFVHSTLVYDRSTMNGLELVNLVRKGSYDLVIDLFGNPRSALLTWLSGASYRVGFHFRGRTYAYNIVAEPRGNAVHNTQFNLDALEAIGVEIHDRNLYFTVSPGDERYVADFLSAENIDGFVVGLNTAGGWYTKRWGLDRVAALGDLLVERYRASVILTWGPGQLVEVRALQSMMRHPGFIPPPTTLSQLGALFKRCTIVVSNDSGPMHVAAAVGTPVLGIYGPTNPVLQGPYGLKHVTVWKEGLDCLGCNLTKCPIGNPCMKELTVETVMKSVEELLKKNSIRP